MTWKYLQVAYWRAAYTPEAAEVEERLVCECPHEDSNRAPDPLVEEILVALHQLLPDRSIWQASEIFAYVQEGYNEIALATGCFWDTDVLPDYAFAFNYSSAFEKNYFIGGDRISGLAGFTSEFERDYIDNAQGPANHNFHWEHNGGFVSESLPAATVELRDDLNVIERATWDTQRIEALRSRHLERDDSRYELNRGRVEAFTEDKDGLRMLRKWRVPSAPYIPYELDDENEIWGILVDITDLTDEPESCACGDPARIMNQHPCGDQWGIVTEVCKEPNAVRIEYQRRGREADREDKPLELPARSQIYMQHYAMARALEREGKGQDYELAAHYQSRYEAGVARMLKRQEALQYQRKYILGGSPDITRKKPLARLPYHFGEVIR